MPDKPTKDEIWSNCERFLSGHKRENPRLVLQTLVERIGPELESDRYGSGALIEDFENEISELIGKESAVFMPSGTMAQQIILRIWAERRNTRNVAFHPTCHLEIHEQKGYQLLHGLHSILVGNPYRLMTLEDIQAVNQPLAALLIELPQREIGGHLPAWEDLVALTGWVREQGIPLHMDGARLWECKPFYQREYAQIAGLFDTVYVSFYKGLGGLAGAILAGPEELIAEARVWQRRHGGNLIRLYPYLFSAKLGLEQRLPRMQDYYEKAQEIAEIFDAFPRVLASPNPPQTNMMHVFLTGDREKMLQTSLDLAQETRTQLFTYLNPTPVPETYQFELTVGDATLELPGEEIKQLFERLFAV